MRPRQRRALAQGPEIPLEVLYADDEFVVVNKPGLLPCHPLAANDRATLMNAVAARYPRAATIGDNPLEGGLVHRLDNGTSGATMVALTQAGLTRLRGVLKSGAIARRYLALVRGRLDRPLQIEVPVAHHPRNPRKMVAVNDPRIAVRLKARAAQTAVTPLRHGGGFTLVEVTPLSGRRHQIRVHLAGAGYPIAGDELYGGPPVALPAGRFFLHLAELRIPRAAREAMPDMQEAVVVAPLPGDLRACLEVAAD
jgi:23S rRNA pseudouridine1911/1915/1917 synthase